MANKPIPTSRRSECPICTDVSGKCRFIHSLDGEFILCWANSSARLLEIIGGYRCVKEAKGENWATFALASNATINPEDLTRKRQERELALRQAREELAKGALPIEDRDRAIRRLHSYFGLSVRHREDLRHRGLTDSQIDHRLYLTINPNQEVPFGIPANLPGVKEGQIKAAGTGYTCVTFDPQGRATGWQIRLDDAIDNKYRWAKGERSSHLANGELPITSAYPLGEIRHSSIWACEGISKPGIAANRLGVVAIGASGANFTSSPQQTEEHLKTASERLDTKEIVFAPDAGALSNQSILKAYKRSWELFTQLGYQVQIAWWNQLDKSHLDLDELESLEAIEFISPKRFWDICNHARQQAERDEKLRQERLKREAEDAIYTQLTTIQEKPWKVINTDKINLEELLEPGAIYIVSSAKGTHKTNALVPVVAKHDRVFAWFNRVALGREECNRVGLVWKDDATSYTNKNKRGFCADSAFQFDPKVLSQGGLLIGDECDQVFSHLFGETCNKDGKRPLILATLEAHVTAAIHGGGMALFMSADVTQRDIDYIKALAPEGCPVRLIVNKYQPERGVVFFDVSENPDGKIEELLMLLEEGTPCFVIDDIKNGVRGCKSIAEYIRTVHPEWASQIIEINSDTSGDPLIIDYLKNINQASKQTLLLCCSPSVVSGISIENKHFGGVFGLFNGILTISEASQAIARVRGAEEIHVWVAQEGLAYEANGSTDPEEIKAWYRRNYEANCRHLLSFKAEYQPITGEWSSPHFDLFCKNAAYRNCCMKRLRERLQARLEEEGYVVIEQEDAGSDMVKQSLRDCWNKIELAEARAIAAANILSDAQMEALHFKTSPLTPEEKLDLQKTLLYKWFGSELIEATVYEHDSGEVLRGYAAMALKNERGVYRQQLENFYLLVSEEGEAIGKDVAVEAKQLRHNQGRFPGDIRWRTRQRKAREWLGLQQFLTLEKWWEPQDYRVMCQKAKSKAPMIKDCLNLTVENISDGQVFGEFMRQVGLELDKEWAAVKPGQRRYKRRRISAESWQYAQMYVDYQQRLKAEREAYQATQEAAVAEAIAVTEECDSECANLITPPDIYIQPSFLGGGDQNLSQGIGESELGVDSVTELAQAEPTQSESLRDRLLRCVNISTFKQLIESASDEEVQAAIDSLPISERDRISNYWRVAKQQEEFRMKSFGQALSSAFNEGIASFRALLSQWAVCDRWAALSQFEGLHPEGMRQLVASAPDWVEWCG